jgi:hypothetical protein
VLFTSYWKYGIVILVRQAGTKEGKDHMAVREYQAGITPEDACALVGRTVGITEWADDERLNLNTYMGLVTEVTRSAIVLDRGGNGIMCVLLGSVAEVITVEGR